MSAAKPGYRAVGSAGVALRWSLWSSLGGETRGAPQLALRCSRPLPPLHALRTTSHLQRTSLLTLTLTLTLTFSAPLYTPAAPQHTPFRVTSSLVTATTTPHRTGTTPHRTGITTPYRSLPLLTTPYHSSPHRHHAFATAFLCPDLHLRLPRRPHVHSVHRASTPPPSHHLPSPLPPQVGRATSALCAGHRWPPVLEGSADCRHNLSFCASPQPQLGQLAVPRRARSRIALLRMLTCVRLSIE